MIPEPDETQADEESETTDAHHDLQTSSAPEMQSAADDPSSDAAEAENDLAPIEPADDPADEDDESPADAGEMMDWKDALRGDFEEWLESVDDIPALAEDGDETDLEAPDFYSFYEQLAVVATEQRRANRRAAEALSQWSDVLARFEKDWQPLREDIAHLASAGEETLPRSYCLILAGFLDRMRRLAAVFNAPPPRTWWPENPRWRHAWEAQRRGFDILIHHFEELLKKAGVSRIETLGKSFDPLVMTAVAAETDARQPHHTVIEEIAAGYHWRGELLRPAQVKVTLNKP
ncbi:MAG: nucleotide exchange factor GrpE [Verrucomicrobia bacterium]|nr:nucleotide exchange factor GrpE [Verrucomicrobiota bacterium]